MKRLFSGFLLFIVLIFFSFNNGLEPILEQSIDKIFAKEQMRNHRTSFKGFFYIMVHHLLEIAPSRWSDQIAAWQPFFGFKIAVLPMDETCLNPEECKELAQGNIILHGDNDIEDNIYYQRIGESRSVLQLGPIAPKEEPIWKTIRTIFKIALIFVFITLTLLWTYPFWRKLNRIRTAAKAFGRGDLDIRVDIPKRSTLFPIADEFNHMAHSIQQLIESHRELTRSVSHELRTPMARMRFHLEMLTDDKTYTQRHINGMYKDSKELEMLISELQTYARFDSQPLRLSARSQVLVPWLYDLVVHMKVELKDKHFRLNTQNNNAKISARFDPKQMGRAISNLLSNAAKYGRSRVELTVAQQGDHILLHVDDDGPGIPEKDRRRIFEPFTRLDASRSRDSGGFGLGLAIVQRVIQWHDGNVSVAFSPLGGARFTLQWPGICE
ncbi:MAG: ATP-binding protein [Desulfobacteraceae bacterium]|jgi:signal transduction histidine kinase